MGKWAKSLFGQETFEKVGIVVAGTTNRELEKRILKKFDKILSSKDSAYHAHLVEKKKKQYPLVFNVYGAAAMIDVMSEMFDGGCRNIIFVGFAYGGFKQHLDVGSIVLPNKAYHFDGIYSIFDPNKSLTTPDKKLMSVVKRLLNSKKIKYILGSNISVPAVTFQLPHANERYKKIKPISLEMELAACFSRSKELGIRSVGILIISDNKSSSIGSEKKQIRHVAKEKILNMIIHHLSHFDIPPLKSKSFTVDEHLASIIEDPEDTRNIYKTKL